ncbi:MAG TPA: hypothetical protein ENJ54_01240 [Chloroflexi bacterium]|nr:hypothetical protein [Chloroflexota bacterium]
MALAGVVLLSLLAGGMVNYLADVLPRNTARPVCFLCGEALPAAAYWRWWQPCLHCGRRRWRHGVVLALAVAAGAALWLSPPKWGFWAMWALVMYALIVIVMDVEHRLILHSVSGAGALLGLGLGVWRHGWLATLLGGAAGAGVMLALFFLGNAYALWKARRAGEPPPEEPALGFGDVTLMGGLGLLLGWPGVWAGLTFAVLLGGAFSLLFLLYGLLRWRRWRLDAYIPYGPFLMLGALWVIWMAK